MGREGRGRNGVKKEPGNDLIGEGVDLVATISWILAPIFQSNTSPGSSQTGASKMAGAGQRRPIDNWAAYQEVIFLLVSCRLFNSTTHHSMRGMFHWHSLMLQHDKREDQDGGASSQQATSWTWRTSTCAAQLGSFFLILMVFNGQQQKKKKSLLTRSNSYQSFFPLVIDCERGKTLLPTREKHWHVEETNTRHAMEIKTGIHVVGAALRP